MTDPRLFIFVKFVSYCQPLKRRYMYHIYNIAIYRFIIYHFISRSKEEKKTLVKFVDVAQ